MVMIYIKQSLETKKPVSGAPKSRDMRYIDTVCNESEKRRHRKNAEITGCHLNADHRLRLVRTENIRCGVNNTGENRRAAKSDQNQSGKRNTNAEGQKQREYTTADKYHSEPDHLFV